MEPVLSGRPALNCQLTIPVGGRRAKESSLVSGAITVGSFVRQVPHIMLNACYAPGKKHSSFNFFV